MAPSFRVTVDGMFSELQIAVHIRKPYVTQNVVIIDPETGWLAERSGYICLLGTMPSFLVF
jgi:hypothetical protein